MRLNQYLAQYAGLSRRQADIAISEGRVVVNDQPGRLGQAITHGDKVELDGHPVSPKPYTYIIMHKPVGYVASRAAQGKHPTLYELLPPELNELKTVGRLDQDSSGLLVLTNDGELAHELTHPSFAKSKSYEVKLNRSLQPDDLEKLGQGVELPDGSSQLEVEQRDDYLVVTMHEGRNRQIRRTFEALGYNVKQLKRTRFGKFDLGDLKPGEFRTVERKDLI